MVIENNFVYSVHMHILSIYGRNAWKRKKKSKKACLLKKLLLVLLFKKCYLKPKIIKTDRISFFVLKRSPSVMLPVLAFFGQKSICLINKTSV